MVKIQDHKPLVSIGLPVYNGEKYLAETLESLLSQTFTDFELIISDNASTDGTEEIAKACVARDSRVRYYRNEANLGASRNFNRVFELASGKYFKWASHDDLCAREYLERCVEALDRDPGVVLCYTRSQAIDEHGKVLLNFDSKPRLGSAQPRERFFESVCVDHPQITIVPSIIFGMIRARTLKRTPLIGNYVSSDGVLLGELALRGRFFEVPEFLFNYRHHSQQSWRAAGGRWGAEVWYDPRRARKITFPVWRLLIEHLISIGRAAPPWLDRAWCYAYMGYWIRLRWRQLVKDLMLKSLWARYSIRPR